MSPIPFTCDCRIKNSVESDIKVLYKAQCSLRADKQVANQDFDPNNLYALVGRHETIRMFIAKAADQNLFLQVADVSKAYLCGNIDKRIIMQQPTNSTGCVVTPGYVCQLRESIYGLPQPGELCGNVIDDKFVR